MNIRFSIILLIILSYYLASCNPYIDWDWNDDYTPTKVHHSHIPEYSVDIDSITSIGDTSIVTYFTIHPYDNFRIDKIYISVSTLYNANSDTYFLLYREEYVNFEVTDCIVSSTFNSTLYPIFLKRDVPIKCCAQLDHLTPNTEYLLFISPYSENEWPSKCIDCPRHPFKTGK